MANQDPKFMVTGEVRLSYVHLFKAYANPSNPGAKPKFSATLVIPKSDFASKQRMDACMNAAVQEGIVSKWNGMRPPVIAYPVYDGDGARPNGDPFSDECRGHWVITASSEQMPEIVDLNMNPIINQSEVYSGIYARVSIRFFPYLSNGKRGVGCGLGNVQKTRDGEPLGGGRTSAASDFGGGAVVAPATGFPAQGYVSPTPAPVPAIAPPAPVPALPQTHTDAAGNQYQLINNQWVLTQPAAPHPLQPALQPAPAAPAAVPIDPITGRPVYGAVMGL